MMPPVSEPTSFPWRRFIAPRFWGVWLALALLRLSVALPYRAQLILGRIIGWFGYWLLPSRRRIARVNLDLCFPELGADARAALTREHFEALGIGLVEAAVCWWGDARILEGRVVVEGLQHLEEAQRDGTPVILLSAHFTTLEIGGRLLGLFAPFHLMYRRNDNPLLEEVVRRNRMRHFERAIPRDDVKDMLRSLRDGHPVWYAPDQNYRGKYSAPVPFFGHPVPTNTATTRLARISGARVIPFFVYRRPGLAGYRLKIDQPLAGFPTDDPFADTLRINDLLERQIRIAPEQYLWIHRRFKTPRDSDTDPYQAAL